jgi:hypothetical protein
MDATSSIFELFGAIEIMESVYNQRLFFVFTRRMNQGPGDDTRTIIDRDADNNWYRTPNNGQGEVKYRAWSIHRMRVQ